MARIRPPALVWYLVRHGETVWNAEGRYQGQTDTPLSDRGREQARELKRDLSPIPLALAVSSDLGRARETAELILEGRGLALRTDPGLREMNYGEFEGLTGDEVRKRAGTGGDSWHRGDPDACAPGGECFREMLARVGRSVDALRAEVKTGNVLLVAHGGALRALVVHLVGFPPAEFCKFRFASASVTVVREDKGVARLWSGDFARIGGG